MSIVAALDRFPGIYQLVEIADRSLKNELGIEVEKEVNRHFAYR